MKKKQQQTKSIRNICIGIIALIIVAFIINTAPGYKRNKYKNVINLVVADVNVTENLKKQLYKDETGTIYIAIEDIGQFLDKTIYYEKESNSIITTSEIEIATIRIGEKAINIDEVYEPTLKSAINKDNTIYIPVEEMKTVYNIQVEYSEDENTLMIDKLNEGMIKAEVAEKTKVRFKPRALSKSVGQLQVGDVVSAFYTTSKGWRLIRTSTGIVGYVKANVLTNEYIVRQDMHQQTNTQEISINTSNNSQANIDGKNILIKDIFVIEDNVISLKNIDYEENTKNNNTWANITISNSSINNYEERTKLIKNIESLVLKRNIKGINVFIKDNEEGLQRFVIEIAPRLKEIGVVTNIIIKGQKQINVEPYTGVVKYIINSM